MRFVSAKTRNADKEGLAIRGPQIFGLMLTRKPAICSLTLQVSSGASSEVVQIVKGSTPRSI